VDEVIGLAIVKHDPVQAETVAQHGIVLVRPKRVKIGMVPGPGQDTGRPELRRLVGGVEFTMPSGRHSQYLLPIRDR
jgi:hypothetical protein